MLRLSNSIIWILAIGMMYFPIKGTFDKWKEPTWEELSIFQLPADSKGKIKTDNKLKSTYTRSDSLDVPAYHIHHLYKRALNHQCDIIQEMTPKNYKYGKLEFDKDDLSETVNLLEKVLSNPKAHKINELFDLFQLSGMDKKGNVKFTGYYIPEVNVSSKQLGNYQTPLPICTENNVYSPIFFQKENDLKNIKLQGSGVLKFTNGSHKFVQYGGRKEIFLPATISLADDIPEEVTDSLEEQLKEVKIKKSGCFNLLENVITGAGIVPLTPDCSIAVDQKFIPLGACLLAAMPVIDSKGNLLYHQYKLLFAQDIGGAVIGKGHVDCFTGVGESAYQKAQYMHHYGHLWMLLPKKKKEI